MLLHQRRLGRHDPARRQLARPDLLAEDRRWPVQAQRALRELVRAWHAAREQCLAEIPAQLAGPLIREFRLDIPGYIDTARKHGCNVIDVLRTAMTGSPWRPRYRRPRPPACMISGHER